MKIKALLLLCGVLVAIGFWNYRSTAKASSKLIISTHEFPHTLDPLEFDLSDLQPIQSATSIRLFSNFADSKITPQLAKSWKSLDSNKEWQIKIRDDIYFSDGKKLSSEDVVRSIQRIIFLCKKRNSKNGFVEYFRDLNSLKAPYFPSFSGVSSRAGQVIFKFTKPMPNFMEAVAFGLYSVVDPRNFSAVDGSWLNIPMEKYLGAGPYSIAEVSSDKIILKLKDSFPKDLVHPEVFKEVDLVFGFQNDLIADAFEGADTYQDAAQTHIFNGGGAIGISYFKVHSWKLRSSPLSNISIRRSLYQKFLEKFSKNQSKTVNSFFPLTMEGIEEVNSTLTDKDLRFDWKGRKEISFGDFREVGGIVEKALVALDRAIAEIGFVSTPRKNITFEFQDKDADFEKKNFAMDVGFYATEVLAVEPLEDIRLMFSREGIHLPDETGAIREELVKEPFSPQKVNEELISQGLVWPVIHRKKGIWIKPSIDLSRYNVLLGLSEIQWIGQR
ncbi:MAG: ABC transporter substrate-binding protein [Bacteriovoracia bacterium]